MYTAETKIRVRYAETDQMGVVYHSNFFPYFESARAEAIREMGLTYADMEKQGVIMPIVEVQCRYLRPAVYDDLLTIKTILKELPKQSKIEFHHEVYNEKSDLLVTAKIILYFMHKETMTRTEMPELLTEKLQSYFD
ncbi:MAG: acyl-CoA thioesterase [Chitinophagaceae bacterium]|nr:acyl-CoA thioesterase [Chitinophagaceae bacterium]MCB9055879.1 acyl-CoA thioesterase [Chitinophagales bacterium]